MNTQFKTRTLAGDAMLLTTALVWGLAFVAQRVGMEHIGPFTFNGIRFALGAGALVPIALRLRPLERSRRRAHLVSGGAAGLVLFVAASLQQIGLVHTTAGNAGFITGLYVVLVPLIGLGVARRIGAARWFAVGLAAVGLYLLSVTREFTINPGDLWVAGSALFFAIHVHQIDRVSGGVNALWFSIIQYLVVAAASLVVGLVTEPVSVTALRGALPAILYGGLGSISIAYTLQVIGQRRAEPSHAAIILSLEGSFAALGGWLILRETLTLRAGAGCALLLTAMIVSQLTGRGRPAVAAA